MKVFLANWEVIIKSWCLGDTREATQLSLILWHFYDVGHVSVNVPLMQIVANAHMHLQCDPAKITQQSTTVNKYSNQVNMWVTMCAGRIPQTVFVESSLWFKTLKAWKKLLT